MLRTHVFVCAVAASLLIVLGCGSNPQDRVAAYEQAVAKVESMLEQNRGNVAKLKRLLEESDELIASAAGMGLSEKQIADIRKVQDETVRALAVAEAKTPELLNRLEAYRAELNNALENGVEVSDEIGLIGRGIGTGSAMLPPPFNAIGAAVGGVLVGVGGLVKAINDGKKRKQTESMLKDVVVSVEKAKNAVDADALKAITEKLKEQPTATSVAVNRIRSEVVTK